MQDLLGLIGSVCLGLCAVPQVLKTLRTKRAGDISWLFLLMWLTGEVAFFIYTPWDLYLHANYGINIVFISIIIYYKVGEPQG